MKKSKKFLTLLLSVCMVLVMMPSMAFAAEADSVKADDIVIVHTNDVHCGVDNYAKVAAYRDAMAKETKYVALVDAGDSLQGDTVGALSRGEYIAEIIKAVGYDIITPGNHEFDWGMDQFMKLSAQEGAKYISANFRKNGERVFDAYTIKEFGDKKVAFVGMNTPETITKSTPSFFQNEAGEFIYDFCAGNNGKDLYAAVQAAIDAAEAEGADYIIGLSHLGIDTQSAPFRSTDVIANTTGMDAVIDGHSHSVIENTTHKNKDGKNVILTQTGEKADNIGMLKIAADGTITAELVKGYAETNATVAAKVKAIQDKLTALTDKYVGKSDITLSDKDADGHRAVRNQESTIGNFCADAYKEVSGAQIGWVQGGGVRESINAGIVNFGDLLAINPWSNTIVVVELTGQQILDALEHGASTCPDENGGFLNVAGMSYDIDVDVPTPVVKDSNGMFVKINGERRVKNVKVADKAIDPAATYSVASTAYILQNQGDGYTMFSGAKDVTPANCKGETDVNMLVKYLDSKLGGTIPAKYAQTEGRINIVFKTYTKDEVNAIAKETVKATKAAVARTTKITSAKAVSKKMQVKAAKNSKADGYYYRIYNAKGKKLTGFHSTKTTYKSSKKLTKGTYTVKVCTYNTIAGEKVYGKVATKTVKVK